MIPYPRRKIPEPARIPNPVSRINTLLVMLLVLGCAAICDAATPIPEHEINSLQQELKQGSVKGRSSVDTRRICKSVIRKAQPLLEEYSDAPNRFELLDVLFQAQQRLLTLEATDKNRSALFETCEMLVEAPDKYAEPRLEADLLLSERALGEVDALVAERVKALKEIVAKYQGTPAERRSLTIAALIASKLQAFDFQDEIRNKLADSSFGGDHKAIAFRRRTHSVSKLDAVFGGTYESVDGSSVTFPFDRLGHQYLVIFWSRDPDGFEGADVFLSRIREQQERFPGRFEVYSFNLDRLPDAGRSILDRAGLKCTALRLPEARASSVYNAYALMDPMAIFVNAQGHAALRRGRTIPWPRPSPARGKVPANPGPGLGLWLDDDRYLAQLRSLFIGDFLVGGREQRTTDHGRRTEEIRKCFVAPPLRYRLAQGQALKNYSKAAELCADALRERGRARQRVDGGSATDADGLLVIRNYRIIALLGMWNVARAPVYLEQAAREAKTVLDMELPPGADVVARFCLAKQALRNGKRNPRNLLATLIENTGNDNARALAAAAVLSIEANAATLYQEYRQRFLDRCAPDEPSLWPVSSFLLDRHHDYRLFWANPGRWGYTRKQRYRVRYLISGMRGFVATNRALSVTLKGLGGGELRIPEDTRRKMTGVVFVEPPAEDPSRAICVKRLRDSIAQFSKQDVPVVVAFLSEDTQTVQSVVSECDGAFRAAMVPGGLRHPVTRRQGILAADRMPNLFLLRPDGTIAWSISGLTYPLCGGGTVEDAAIGSIWINIEKLRTDGAFHALAEGDFKRALLLLDKRLPPKKGKDPWTHARLHGRALAHMGLKNWEAALADIDAAISRLRGASRYGKRVHSGSIEMHFVKAAILGKLGRTNEAENGREDAEKNLVWLETAPYFHPPSFARNGIPVGVYTDLLRSVRLRLEKREK